MKSTLDMAREAGLEQDGDNFFSPMQDEMDVHIADLKRFEALVRADERNRTWTQEHWTEYEQAIVAAEREACAKVAEDFLTSGRSPLGRSVAAAIRARLEQPEHDHMEDNLAMVAAPVQEPVARVIDDGTPEGATEWIPFTNRVEPLKTGDLLYTTPPYVATPLAAPVQNGGVGGCAMCGAAYEDQVIKAPVQEPVAFVHNKTGLLRQANRAKGGDFEPSHWTPLYTTPPAAQRQWVWLTDEEIEDIHCTPPRTRPRGKFPFARMIEAKLKEKNT